MLDNYLSVLEESLNKKIEVLGEIQEYNKKQYELFQTENVDVSAFDDYVSEKGMLIEKVNELDKGFETLYAGIAEQLKENQSDYSSQIARLQELIAEVMEKSVSVQTQEERNKKVVEEYFSKARASIGKGRKASKAAYDYYKSMSLSNTVPPQFMDKKK